MYFENFINKVLGNELVFFFQLLFVERIEGTSTEGTGLEMGLKFRHVGIKKRF
jgi:hypothetical protein